MRTLFKKLRSIRQLFYFPLLLLAFAIGCDKDDSSSNEPISTGVLNENTIIIEDELYTSLITVGENQIIFTDNDQTSTIKASSILVSDSSEKAPNGFLRKVISVATVNGQKICETEQASLTDALKSARVRFTRNITDEDLIAVDSSGNDISDQQRDGRLSLRIPLYRTFGGVRVSGECDIKSEFDFELSIDDSKISYFKTGITIKNTNTLNFEATRSGNIHEERILATYELAPFTVWIGPLPIPLKQRLVLIMGVDGEILAKISGGATNTNTVTAGIEYSGNQWKNISDIQNSFEKKPVEFEGKAKVEVWLQAGYELRPYALPSSRIFLAAKGSVLGEIKQSVSNNCKVAVNLDWGVELSAKAKMAIFNRTIASYDATFFSHYYPIYRKEVSSLRVKTNPVTDIVEETGSYAGARKYKATSGGFIKDSLINCNTTVLERGVCWDTLTQPTIFKSRSSDGSGKGTYTSQLTQLKGGKTYYARAYARTSSDTIYGDQKEFKTSVHVKIEFVPYDYADISRYNNKIVDGIRFSFASQRVSMINEQTFRDCFETDYYSGGYQTGSSTLYADISGIENITKITVVMHDNCGRNCSRVTVCDANGLIDKVTNGNTVFGNFTKTFDMTGKNPKKVTFASLEGWPVSIEIE